MIQFKIGYTFYMRPADGAHEDIHKKVLGPTAELHEAHRQVNSFVMPCEMAVILIDQIEFSLHFHRKV